MPPSPRANDTDRFSRRRPRLPLLAGAAGLVLLLAGGVITLLNHQPPASPQSPGVTETPALVAPQHQNTSPKPGQSWKNSLGMRYVPVSDVHFATTETRVKDFAAFVEATGYEAEGGMYSHQQDGFKQHGHTWKSPGLPQSPDHPVVGVSYEDATFFCDWLTRKERSEGRLSPTQLYRLPTDREWSEAAGFVNEVGATPEVRSGKVKAFAWGAGRLRENATNFAGTEVSGTTPPGWPVIAGYRDNSPRTCVVPGHGPNARGIYDLGGNVWEWCHDRFNKTTNLRVLRGGSWATANPQELLLSFRRSCDPISRHDDIGFRCVIATDSAKR